MSYSGGDGQTLGIILTPKHIPHDKNKVCKFINFENDGYRTY